MPVYYFVSGSRKPRKAKKCYVGGKINMKKFLSSMDQHFEEIILGIFLLLITAVIFVQVITRYAISSSLIWAEEFARYCLVCSTIFSLAYCMRKGIMMKIDIVADFFPKGVRKVLNLFIYLLSLCLYTFLFYYSIDVARIAATTNQKSTAMQLPMSLIYWICTFALALTVLRTVQCIILYVKNWKDGEDK